MFIGICDLKSIHTIKNKFGSTIILSNEFDESSQLSKNSSKMAVG